MNKYNLNLVITALWAVLMTLIFGTASGYMIFSGRYSTITLLMWCVPVLTAVVAFDWFVWDTIKREWRKDDKENK